MNLVVAVKAEPRRIARVTGPNRITLLLSTTEEAADTTITHRDGSYMDKLQGRCFKCSRLNANPDQSVCGTVLPDPPPTSCSVFEDPCNCADCPPVPEERTCACTGGYPDLEVGLGSGYWVGLQANTYYSQVYNGGWVVAVLCNGGAILGAFPVTGTNYGYGSGTLAGESVMIYPSGAVRGAGFYPANDTSFPILAVLPEDGDALVETGFNIINESPTCPNNVTSDIDYSIYFCPEEGSTTYAGYPKACLAKYPREKTTGCAEYDDFYEWPDGIPYETRLPEDPYSITMGGVTGFDPDAAPTLGSILFETDDGKKYCSSIEDWTAQRSDALFAGCGARRWADDPVAFYDNCVDCTDENIQVPCQFLVNLTNGPVSFLYGGYNSAAPIGNGGYYGIGPALPPTVTSTDPAVFSNTDQWETFWNWSRYTIEDGTNNGYYVYDNNIVFIPPIGRLLDKCICNNNEQRQSGVFFVERFPCCGELQNGSGSPEGWTIVKPFTPGYSGCGAACYAKCPNVNCSCNFNSSDTILAKPDIYGYIPCWNCEDVTLFPTTGIWWAPEVKLSDQTSPFPPYSSSSERNRCKQVYNSFQPQCSGACVDIYDWDEDAGIYTINSVKFQNCNGFRTPLEFLESECARIYYFPKFMKDCKITYIESLESTTQEYADKHYLNVFAKHLIFEEDCGECSAGQSVADCLCPRGVGDADCYLHKIGGPLSISRKVDGSTECTSLDQLNQCSVPVIEEQSYTQCGGASQVAFGLTFKNTSQNDRCIDDTTGYPYANTDPAIADPCSCCTTTISPDGLGVTTGIINPDLPIPSLDCFDDCGNECCKDDGCRTGNCDPNVTLGTCSGGGDGGGGIDDPGGGGGL